MWLLAGSLGARNIRELSLDGGQLGTPIPVSGEAATLSQSSTGLLAVGLATASTGAVDLCSGTTGAVLTTIPVAGPVRSIAFGDDGTTLFSLIGTATVRSVAVIDTSTDKVLADLPAPVDAIVVVPLTNETGAYVLESDGYVSQISSPGGQVVFRYPVGAGAVDLALSPDGRTLYVLKAVNGSGTSNVSVLNTLNESTKRVLPAPAHTVAIVLSPDGSTLYDLVGTASVGNVQSFSLGG